MPRKKSSKSKNTGLGLGLDALIKAKTRPVEEREDDFAVENLETVEEKKTEESSKKPAKNPSKKVTKSKPKNISKQEPSASKTLQEDKSIQTSVSIDDERVELVVKAVKNNPRITLWSSKSAAVLRYLKKTQPEFSISNEASKLIDEAVKEKYPEIWALFEDI